MKLCSQRKLTRLKLSDCLLQARYVFENIEYAAEYHVEVELLRDRNFHGDLKFYTPTCQNLSQSDHQQCLSNIPPSIPSKFLPQSSTLAPKISMEVIGGTKAPVYTGEDEFDSMFNYSY